jgi:hypothetical protein
LRALLVAVLAAALVGCGRQPPPEAATLSCTASGLVCLERTAGPPIKLVSLRVNSAATDRKSASARKAEKPSSADARHGARVASKTAKSTTIAAKTEHPGSRIPLPPDSPKTRLQSADGPAAADSGTARETIAEPHPTVGVANSNTGTVKAQVAAATMLAERLTVATTPAAPDMKANNRDKLETSVRGSAGKSASASANNADLLVAVLMTRPDIKSVSDLTGRNIAIDERYSASNGSVRTAIVAAGAPEVQLSEGQTTAIDRLVKGEVPAAVLALVSADAAEAFPEIAGFRIFHVPLSPRSLKARP